MSGRYMRDDEICVRYDQAKDQAEQIKILAELNDMDRREIEEILVEHGRMKDPPRRVPKRRPKRVHQNGWTPEEERYVLQMYREGVSQHEIARITGRSQSSVCNRLQKLKEDGYEIGERKYRRKRRGERRAQ